MSESPNAPDQYLAGEYSVEPSMAKAYDLWHESHRPFHWFAEFYGIMRRGGFDVIIGNPPYLERHKLGNLYSVKGLRTAQCRDIYAWVVERCFSLRSSVGKLGLIVPVSLASSGSFDTLRQVVSEHSRLLWLSHFANRPGQLCTGAQNRLTILLAATSNSKEVICSTRYHRWDARGGGRECLFQSLYYLSLGVLAHQFHGLFPKIGNPEAASVLHKTASNHTLSDSAIARSAHAVHWVRVPGYFCQFFLDPPKARPEKGGPLRIRGEVNTICFPDKQMRRVVHALLNSSTYYHFFAAYTDGRHINPSDVSDFPVNLASMDDSVKNSLIQLSEELEDSMRQNTSFWRKNGLLIESVDSPPTKPVLDEIDRVLAKYFGFIETEIDFIINYDYKFRIGQSNAESVDED